MISRVEVNLWLYLVGFLTGLLAGFCVGMSVL